MNIFGEEGSIFLFWIIALDYKSEKGGLLSQRYYPFS